MYNFGAGYIEPSTTGTSYQYQYYMKDHLGNNRVVSNLGGTILQTNHYYPYGANIVCSTNSGRQQYKYNGKELDRTHGLNWYDYLARQYDAALGQFTSMDPLCEKYYHISPYVYCGGNPVRRVDPDGRDWYEYGGKRQWRNSVDKTYTDNNKKVWKKLGHTFTDNKTGKYYSLFGQIYNSNHWDLNAVKTIDEALIYNAKYRANFLSFDREPTYDFSKMYRYVEDKSIFEDKNLHYITYGDDKQNGTYTHIWQLNNEPNNRTNAMVHISETFHLTDTRGYNGTRLTGYEIRFTNDSRNDLVLIVFRPERGKFLQTFYNKLVNSYKK